MPLSLPFQKFRLDNGLTVILHPDTRFPRVAVNICYRVGSCNDPRQRSGMAHLFEHLMFMGTRRVPDSQFDLLMEQHGGSNNAFTCEDLTDYYDVGPAQLLETLLWIEADRMGTLVQAMTSRKLKLQRDVVLNERQQSYENSPYGVAYLEMPGLLYPSHHPYHWPVIGGREDLMQVTVGDVKDFFCRYYSPRNASLVVAGDFDVGQAQKQVRRYFEWLPAEAPPRRPRYRPIAFKQEVRRTFLDNVELPKLFFAWHSPPYFMPGDADMDLAASILTVGRQSRLHRALVLEKRLALEVEAEQESRRLGSLFVLEITARPGVDLGELERATEEVLARFCARPPSKNELTRAQNGYETHFISRLERLSRRAELLNLYTASLGRPDLLQEDVLRYRQVDRESLHRWSKRILHPRRRAVIQVLPEVES